MVGRRVPDGLLRRHVRRGSDGETGRRQGLGPSGTRAVARRRLERLGDAEVGHHGVPALEQEVLRLDVAVDDALLVRVRQRVGGSADDLHRLTERQPPVARESLPERLALNEGHRVVEEPIGVARGEHRDDVRVPKPRRERDLALEPLGAHLARELGRKHLHNDAPTERRLGSHEDAAHAPAPEFALECVAAGKRPGQAGVEGCVAGRQGGFADTLVVTHQAAVARYASGVVARGGPCLEEAVGVIRREECLHLGPQRRVLATRMRDERQSLAGGALECRAEHRLDLAPALRRHDDLTPTSHPPHGAPSARRSHARATRHSRLTVAVETPSTAAVSSMLSPAK